MFRSARWRTEKNRVKAVFKLHFHVTQVFQSGLDALMLSIVPGDIGKPTMRLEKAAVRDGICRWDNAVYETVKFIHESKTGKFSDKIYHFLVSTGLSKASSIGEVSINFADYVEATKPSAVSLPFKNSHCDAVLHISIQRLQQNSDQREEDECEDAKLKSDDRSLRNKLSNGDTDESTQSYSSEDVSAKAIINRAELSADCRTSSGSDITLSSSDESSGLDTPREIGLRKTNIHPNTNQFLTDISHASEPQNPAANASTSMHDVHQSSHWDWSAGSEQGLRIDDSTNGSHNALPKERSQEASSSEIERLKAELAALARQVDVSDMELQTLRKRIVKESKRGKDLTKEIIILKEERDSLKTECDNLRSFHKRMAEAKMRNRSQLESGDLVAFVEEIREELNYEKDLNANLRLQLKKMQESNAELVLAVQDVEEMLEQKNRDICNHSNKCEQGKNSQELGVNLSKCETDDDGEQKALEELVKVHSNAKETHLLEKKIIDLYGEIEMYRRDKDELEMQMEQLALDYEILKQENHGIAYKLEQSQLQEQLKMQYECSSPPAAMNDIDTHIQNLENQLNEQSEEFSNSLATIKVLETHIKRLEEELEKQAHGFEADLEAVTRDKVEQEQRAIQAEEALRKTRLKNANTAERLQEEFRRLSIQMTSTFDANEKAAMRALTEASELRAQKSLVEEMLHKVKEELQSVKADYEVKLNELSNQIDTMTVQMQQMLLEIEDKSKQLENQQQHGEQVSRDFSEEIEMLKAENENLKVEISRLYEQVEQKEILRTELEVMKKSVEESETLLRKRTKERNELLSTIALLKKEAEQSLNELNRMRHLKDEKETEDGHLHSELEAVRAQCSDLKRSLFDDEAEKEKLRKLVFQLKGELKKKDDALTSMEKRFRDSNGRTQIIPKNQKTALTPQNLKELANLREKIKTLEGLVQSKETALDTSTTSFLEKEKELQTKIEELENKLEEFNRSIALQKVVQDSTTISSEISGEVSSTVEHLNNSARGSEETGAALLFKSNINLPEKEAGTSIVDTADSNNLSGILNELSSLKERNKSMETELKEMQERYSEMSLKFAEVEGERQKLVMTVRNLKSIQKG
ncbi:intracellular protein transport protein USO1-like [Gastrolobium bilobum]|uniref:intracellular protein transport protein USO1-like n=1 Tax=Gastrolobium bilobum TaxID=150636 RepID=UPI002AB13B7E|nr:intracellular protein transport protein USO1-like [Gastrolobium bilobum]